MTKIKCFPLGKGHDFQKVRYKSQYKLGKIQPKIGKIDQNSENLGKFNQNLGESLSRLTVPKYPLKVLFFDFQLGDYKTSTLPTGILL